MLSLRFFKAIVYKPITRRYFSAVAEVELTSIRYKDNVRRGNFATINKTDIGVFQEILGKERVLTDSSDLELCNVDWLRMVKGASSVLLKPKTTDEVSRILKHCNERKLAVCPQGGNTGLVGGSVPVFDEIVLSTSLMNQIIGLDEWSDVLSCQAGCVLEALNDYLVERDLIMPLDLGAKGSCQIGANASTNAGGLRLIRYGSLHSTILGVEVVLADGTVLDCMSSMKKDNTGYDLKHLFIGSEGTLGIVTKVSIHCPTKPSSVAVAFLGLGSYEKVLSTMRKAKRSLGEILSSLEYMDGATMQIVIDALKLRCPIGDFPFYMLIETSGSNITHDQEKLSVFLEDVMNSGLVTDGTVASDIQQALEIWSLRERIAEAGLNLGYVYKYDLSIPVVHFDNLVQAMRKRLGDNVKSFGYGHLGDGNIHLNLVIPEYDPKITKLIEPFVFEWVRDHNGSISAEHGLGFKKRDFISYSKSSECVTVMKKLKELFDPHGILNPYKVLPTDEVKKPLKTTR